MVLTLIIHQTIRTINETGFRLELCSYTNEHE